jgi:hypothetical protein
MGLKERAAPAVQNELIGRLEETIDPADIRATMTTYR